MRISKEEFDDILHLLDVQRTHAIDYASDCGVAVNPDALWILNNDKFDASANRQISYYNGHTNMVDSMLRQMEPRRFLHVKGNKHYISK